jgi:hypothetical protein
MLHTRVVTRAEGNRAMRYITVLVVALLFASPLLAETPCDFKGISVGSKMSPAQLMSALGMTKYKTNPPPHSPSLALTEKYGFIAAGEIEDSEIGPYCSTTMCTVPAGVAGETTTTFRSRLTFHFTSI